MLFMVINTHDYSTCMAQDEDKMKVIGDIVERASEFGVTIHARYSNRLEHTNFYVIESNDMESIDKLFEPVLTLGHWDITPVVKK